MTGNVDEQIAEETLREWLGSGAKRTPIVAMNSSAWMVSSGGERYVLKIADAQEQAGLCVAVWLEKEGLPTGAPLEMTLRGNRVVALLRFVDGHPLGDSHRDVDRLGETLGRVHARLVGAPVPAGLDRWPWAWLDPAVIDEPELGRAATEAIETAERLAPTVTHGILHGDPNQGAFLARSAGIALIDWGSACHGPLLYDVASAWLYTDRRVLAAYARTGPIPPDEMVHAAEFLAFRGAVQACYFSMRIHRGDLTGLAPGGNEEGLADARRRLLG